MIDDKIKELLVGIRFTEKYKAISDAFRTRDTMKKTDKHVVLKMLQDLGLSVKYFTKGNFFQVKHEEKDFEFIMNMDLKYGSLDVIPIVRKDGVSLKTGGPNLTYMAYDISNRQDDKIPLPTFSSYEELNEIFEKVIQLYIDIKQAFLNSDIA